MPKPSISPALPSPFFCMRTFWEASRKMLLPPLGGAPASGGTGVPRHRRMRSLGFSGLGAVDEDDFENAGPESNRAYIVVECEAPAPDFL